MTALSLIVVAALSGAAFAWAFLRISKRTALSLALRRILGHLAELRLYFDEPALVWRAHKDLAAANLRLLLLLLPPSLLLALPAIWLYAALDSIYGFQRIPIGAPAIVSARFAAPRDAETAPASLAASPEIAIETAPVRTPSDGRISWRIRALRPVCGLLRFTMGGVMLEKRVAAGGDCLFVSPRRSRSPLSFFADPPEPRLPPGPLVALKIDYPSARIQFAGLTLPWLAWFLPASTLGAWTLIRRY